VGRGSPIKIIKKLYDQIDDELDGALDYAKDAVEHADEHPIVAKTWYEISLVECTHVDLLHKRVVEIITDYRAKHGEAPAAMQAVYDYLHKKAIDKMAEIRRYQDMYKQK
jgi:hypothetical protein